jgi:hypothetical protein
MCSSSKQQNEERQKTGKEKFPSVLFQFFFSEEKKENPCQEAYIKSIEIFPF